MFEDRTIDEEVEVEVEAYRLGGHMNIPHGSVGIVVFSHGSGSSRHSPRNQHVAEALNRVGLSTLLFDLLTSEEEMDRSNVFDVELLGDRLTAATNWLTESSLWTGGQVGYFGASTGAAAALWAAAEPDSDITAVVSRGGRPDLAAPRLGHVRAPTLLIVGGHDQTVLEMNRDAQAQMKSESRIEVVPGAGHLFEEPRALDRVSDLAAEWFTSHLNL